MSAAPDLEPSAEDVVRIKVADALLSFSRFARRCKIITRRGYEPFTPWPHQERLMATFEAGESVVILKARQLGISWLIVVYVLWLAMSRPHQTIILLSQGQLEADKLLEKCFHVWTSLPWWLRRASPLLKHTTSNPASMRFVNGSEVIALPSTEKAGRSFTAHLIVADEAAFHQYAEANYAAYKPTLDGGGQLIMCSTANGPAGLFHDLFEDARNGRNTLRWVFIPWWARPDRQTQDVDGNYTGEPSPVWLERERSDHRGTVQKFRAEYPSSPGEAFRTVTGLVYGMDDDGVLIFNGDAYPHGNVRPDPFDWFEAKWRYAGIDWGGGDPTAMGFYGLHNGRMHKFFEHHWSRAITIEEAHAALLEHAMLLPDGSPDVRTYDVIPCGVEEKTTIRTLASYGWAAEPARVAREEGFGYTKYVLKKRLLTFHPELEYTLREFDSYYWRQARDQRSKVEYDTSTPQDHHADHMDEMRYVVFEWQISELSRTEGDAFKTVRLGGRV